MKVLLNSLHARLRYNWIKNHPKQRAEQLFLKEFGRELNWDNPTILPEKGRWIQFCTDTSHWPLYADKYRVRDVIKGKHLEKYLPELYGKWDNANDIDFDILPNSFVLKTNHGSGEVIVVKDKSLIDRQDVRNRMQKFLSTPYGVMTAEPHYLKIKPCIIAEQFLEHTCPESTYLVDYKFFCSFGVPFMLDICYDRNPETRKAVENILDINWKEIEGVNRWTYTTKAISKPASFGTMVDICKELVAEFPLIRLDFYDVNGHPYIGEFTLTPSSFDRDFYTDKGLIEMGNCIDLSRIPKTMIK